MSDTNSKDDELSINKYPQGIVSPMVRFEIAVTNFDNSTKSKHHYEKLRIARIEFAKSLTKYGIQERIDELDILPNHVSSYQWPKIKESVLNRMIALKDKQEKS